METDSLMMEVLIQYQRKFNIVNEISRLTVEMGDLLSKNDHVSTGILLDMRRDEMNKADQCNRNISMLEEAMSAEDCQNLHLILDSEDGGSYAKTPEEKRVFEINKQIRLTLKKTVEIDKRINMKIAGKDSYYSTATK